ncbi:hypothetical protein ACFWBB_12075 [Streptomyces sp. NPDC060000]
MTSSSPFAVPWNSDQLALLQELASSSAAPVPSRGERLLERFAVKR